MTNDKTIFYYFFPEENCEAGAQLEGICFQTGLLYFLTFFYHLSVVSVGCWVLVLIVGNVCRLYCICLSLFVGCRLLSADSVDCLVL